MCFCINYKIDAQNLSVLNNILYSIDNPTNENIINAYDNIINSRCFKKNSYSFDMINSDRTFC